MNLNFYNEFFIQVRIWSNTLILILILYIEFKFSSITRAYTNLNHKLEFESI